MTVTFTLTGGSASTDAGPFNISGTTSGGASNGESIATGVTKEQLLTGHTITNILDTITGGTIASTGTCTTTDTWSVTPSPTPTSTPIPPTPTAVASYEYAITPTGFGTRSEACSDFTMSLPSVVYAAEQSRNSVTRFFTNSNLTNGFPGAGGYYCWRRDVDSDSQRVSGEINSASGYITSAIEVC